MAKKSPSRPGFLRLDNLVYRHPLRNVAETRGAVPVALEVLAKDESACTASALLAHMRTHSC